MSPALTHLALHVRDLSACVDFYRDWLNLEIVHERGAGEDRVVWLAEPERQRRVILIFIPGGPGRDQASGDFSHLGFAVESREAVDALAARAEREGCQAWPIREEAPPVGYYFGLRDPDGRVIELSFGQPIDTPPGKV